MNSADLLADAFGRIRQQVHASVEGLAPQQLTFRVDEDANSIAWLLWHLTRIQDDHIADAAQVEQTWTAAGWADRFGLPFPATATGFGHSSADVAAVAVPSGDLLTAYHDAVSDHTMRYVHRLTDADLDRIVDESWEPPVSLGVRLVSVIGDNTQHAGQAAFLHGILLRRTTP
ncbi:MAG: mycothiol transferase [Nocardioidaceae bacterium]